MWVSGGPPTNIVLLYIMSCLSFKKYFVFLCLFFLSSTVRAHSFIGGGEKPSCFRAFFPRVMGLLPIIISVCCALLLCTVYRSFCVLHGATRCFLVLFVFLSYPSAATGSVLCFYLVEYNRQTEYTTLVRYFFETAIKIRNYGRNFSAAREREEHKGVFRVQSKIYIFDNALRNKTTSLRRRAHCCEAEASCWIVPPSFPESPILVHTGPVALFLCSVLFVLCNNLFLRYVSHIGTSLLDTDGATSPVYYFFVRIDCWARVLERFCYFFLTVGQGERRTMVSSLSPRAGLVSASLPSQSSIYDVLVRDATEQTPLGCGLYY